LSFNDPPGTLSYKSDILLFVRLKRKLK